METFSIPVIETGIPIPDRPGLGGQPVSAKRLKFNEILGSMKLGDSVLLLSKNDMEMMTVVSHKLKLRIVRRTIFQDGQKMFRVWRVKGEPLKRGLPFKKGRLWRVQKSKVAA